MLALYRSGRQADALETFQEARRVLADELGLEPGPELRRLQDAILAHDSAIASVPVARLRRGNLPAPSTSFIGRDDELGRVAALLHEHRLATLTGPPGVGKSRLAVETARPLEAECPDGIWLVDFARAGDAADAVRLLATAVDVRGPDPLARVTSRLRDAEALLVLDACEHVLHEAAQLASTLLAECPRLRILATSREALHVAGEVRVPVAPLGGAAVDLFVERARAARPGFEPDAEDVALAAEIARRVDGLPLAIELAAARVNVLGLSELVSILERRTSLLRDSPASDPSRTALEALVAWSYDLLHGDEKTLLQQLAVHRGGASLASLVAVAATHGLNEATVAYLVSALVDKSIVSASFARGEARYDMLDTVREYVLERLDEGGDLAAARGAHAEYFAALAAAARLELRGREWLRWQRRLQLENDNLWAALAYARDVSDPAVAVRLGTLAWYFALGDRVSEGRRFLELALSVVSDEAPVGLRIELLAGLCYLAAEELDLAAALACGERAVSLAATAAAPWELAFAQLMLSLAVAQSGDVEGAAGLTRDASATFEAGADDWGIAATDVIRAIGAAQAGDVSTVTAMAATAGRHAEAIGYDAFRVPALLLEAWGAEQRCERADAVDAYRRALEVARRVGFGDHAAFALAGLGTDALARGDLAEAEKLQLAGIRHCRGRPGGRRGRPCACPARPDRGGGRRRGRGRAAVPRGPRVVAGPAPAPGSREPVHRARRQSGRRGAPRARGDRRDRRRHRLGGRPPPARRPRAHLSWQNRRRAWQRVGIADSDSSCCPRTDEEEARMSTTTIEDQLAEVRRRIDRMQALAQFDATAASARIQRHVDAVHHDEASVLSAARRAPDEVDAKLGQLKTRVAVAENSLYADLSEDWDTFAAAVESELRGWDTYLERLQTGVAAKAWKAREQAEAAIGDVRDRRLAVDERLAQARDAAGDVLQEARTRVTAARDELEEKADELSAKLN